ncbi:zinc ribbon domain-containing protein [Candidatus Bipolaricaulota bacterium]|nr:zinc ribbon domain-containing protein [Candidatus Bipolaricaulota bacterium]
MPLYKYRCTECDNTFKVLQRNGKKDEEPECPVCGARETERVISSVGIRFKGSGFYRTDYGDGNSSYKGNGNNGGKDGNGKGSGETGKSEKEGASSGRGED